MQCVVTLYEVSLKSDNNTTTTTTTTTATTTTTTAAIAAAAARIIDRSTSTKQALQQALVTWQRNFVQKPEPGGSMQVQLHDAFGSVLGENSHASPRCLLFTSDLMPARDRVDETRQRKGSVQ